MWLINVKTMELEEFFDSRVPKYAILSHVWGAEEISFTEMGLPHESHRLKAGFVKIVKCSTEVKNRFGLDYVWVDTCCIDKRNSAELFEAINSMYRYYCEAAVCFIYLIDVPGREQLDGSMTSRAEQLEAMKSSRWFTRGWTLQELVAPRWRHFFAKDWTLIRDDPEKQDLMQLVSEVTNISLDLLTHKNYVPSYCIAERMSWASSRQTTRSEDIAYSLMGLFNVNMPVIYGEGSKSAFKRLQKELIQSSFDQTIFAWRGDYETSGLLAKSPSDFAGKETLGLWAPDCLEPFSLTNVGLSIGIIIKPETDGDCMSRIGDSPDSFYYGVLQCDIKIGQHWKILLIRLQQIEGMAVFVNGEKCKAYRRVNCAEWNTQYGGVTGWPREQVLILEDEHHNLIEQAELEHEFRWGGQDRENESRLVYGD